MRERGVHQAIVFVGDDDRARRSAAAFTAQFESLGGQVLDEATLGDNVDYSDAIKAALTDAPPDAGILLLMRPQTARLLMPQLHLANVTQPVFATSLIYAGGDNATARRRIPRHPGRGILRRAVAVRRPARPARSRRHCRATGS